MLIHEQRKRGIDLKEEKKRKHGTDIVTLLTLIFVALKVTNHIEWSWVWVFSPIWITVLFFGVVFGLILIGGRIAKGKW